SASPPEGGPTGADVEQALSEDDPAKVQQVAEDVGEALEELYGLATVLDEKMGSAAPNLLDLRTAVEQCTGLARDFSARRSPEIAPEVDSGIGAPAAGGAGGVSAAPPSSRAEVYAHLKRASAVLRAMEPHSPVPYLIDRAIELGDLPFHKMIRQLVRDAN